MATVPLTDFIAKFPRPSNLSVSFPKDWGPEATNAFGASDWAEAAKNLGAEAVSAVIGNSASAAASNNLGVTINKNEKVLFRTLPFRTMNFQWNLVPKSSAQAQEYIDIIKVLKKLTAPSLPGNGAIFQYPVTFSLEIQAAETIFKSPDMACTDLVVNYTPQGFWAQHTDKQPVAIGLQMSFMERELATQEAIGDTII